MRSLVSPDRDRARRRHGRPARTLGGVQPTEGSAARRRARRCARTRKRPQPRAATIVLRSPSGVRYVRAGWFQRYVTRQGSTISRKAVRAMRWRVYARTLGGWVVRLSRVGATGGRHDTAVVKKAAPASWWTLEALQRRHDSPSMTERLKRLRFACGIWTLTEGSWDHPPRSGMRARARQRRYGR